VRQLRRFNRHGGREFVFSAILHAQAGEVRAWQFTAADVIFEPKDYDYAHANIAFLQHPPVEVLNILDDIIGALHVAAPSDLARIPEASGGPPVEADSKSR
jgi:hypothetical protein